MLNTEFYLVMLFLLISRLSIVAIASTILSMKGLVTIWMGYELFKKS